MILGIDPGVHGALAICSGESLTVSDMPTVQRRAGARGTQRTFIDETGLVAILSGCALFGYIVVIEQVGGIPGQAAAAAFTFGRGTGFIIGAARALGMRVEEAPPATWKSALRVPADKTAARGRASELFPRYADLWALAKHDGRAEAAMIALWGWQVFGPQQL